jgi:hypothetical protein
MRHRRRSAAVEHAAASAEVVAASAIARVLCFLDTRFKKAVFTPATMVV